MPAAWLGAGKRRAFDASGGRRGTDRSRHLAACGLEAQGLANGLSKRLVSELQPAALKPTSANMMTEGRKDARNATGNGMVYPLILRRNGYE